jgi:hypothetical protein
MSSPIFKGVQFENQNEKPTFKGVQFENQNEQNTFKGVQFEYIDTLASGFAQIIKKKRK